jgi:uncharacterized membrane protein YgcG
VRALLRQADRWRRVEECIDEFYRHVWGILSSSRIEEKDSNILYQAVVGKRVAYYSRIERIIVTELGAYAPRLFRPFFDDTSDLRPPFDFMGYLDGRLYHVKVVAGDRAFNSSVRKTVEEASRDYARIVRTETGYAQLGNIVILTVQGKRFEPVKVGYATWYDAEASWRLVAGPNGYSTFRSLVYDVAGRYREKIWGTILEKRETCSRRRGYSSSRGSSSSRLSHSSSSSSSSSHSSSSSGSSSSSMLDRPQW